MVPSYLEFDDLVKTGTVLEGRLRTLSKCGGFEVVDQLPPSKVTLRDATGINLVLDRRD